MSKWKQIESCDVINHLASGRKVKGVVIDDRYSVSGSGVYNLCNRSIIDVLEMIQEGCNLFFEEVEEEEK